MVGGEGDAAVVGGGGEVEGGASVAGEGVDGEGGGDDFVSGHFYMVTGEGIFNRDDAKARRSFLGKSARMRCGGSLKRLGKTRDGC